jgi:hypothetical protein
LLLFLLSIFCPFSQPLAELLSHLPLRSKR